MIQKQEKIVPLEYASMGASLAPPSWTPLVAEETVDRAELLARIEHLQSEKGALSAHLEQQIASARAEAYEAARRDQSERLLQQSELARGALLRAIEAFDASREEYFTQVEKEVVRLALAVAARILHREAQMDPLLLSGAVRVALGQLSESTEVRLHVPLPEVEMWGEMLRLMPNLPLRPSILPDDRMQAGECRLETHLGSVDLGVRAQLTEIERGFFDLLQQRVTVSHAETA